MVGAATSWARRWSAARLDRCEAGHGRHERVQIEVNLAPEHRPVPDCPAPPWWVGFPFTVFDAARYEGTEGYCPGDDELSRTLVEQGCWEPWQTALTVDILASHPDRAVIDLGCHCGWYSTMAVHTGHRVYALDADTEHVALACVNAAGTGHGDRLEAAVGWLDADSAPLRPEETGPVRLAKVDVEGAEDEAARVLAPLLARRTVDFALVELSPEFGDRWRDALGIFAWAGYTAHLLPDKGDDVDAFERAPLRETLGRDGPDPRTVTAQCTVLFAAPVAP